MSQTAGEAAVAAIVLNWRRYEDTAGCLESLRQLSRRVRVYLVDQESDPTALARLQGAFPEVVALPLGDNLGYSAGMNHGIERALTDGSSHLLLLNNDLTVTPPLVERLLKVFTDHPDTGIAGPGVRFPWPDGRIQAEGIDVGRLSGRVRLRNHGAAPGGLEAPPCRVDAVPGSALMVRADVLRRIGLFDPGYYFYFEDIDLCLRARSAGYAVRVEPGAVVYHRGGASIGSSPEQVYYGVRNQLRVLEQQGIRLPASLGMARSGFIVGLHLAQLLRGGKVGTGTGLRFLGRGVRDFRAGRLGPYRSR